MEVRPGYKLTDIGVLPEDWDVKQLHQISPKQSVGLVINPSTYFDARGTVPMLVGSNVGENKIDWIHAKRISINSHKKLPGSTIYAGDLVTVRVGDPGTTAVIPEEFDSSNCASMMIVRRGPAFDSTWLCYMMNSKHGRSQIEGVQYGTAQKQFNISDAVNFQYPVPSLPEQRAIATALSDADALLDGLTRLITKKRDLKQATMQQLLTGRTRLPGFSGAWVPKTLGDLGSTYGGLTGKTKSDFGVGTSRYITFMNVMTNVVIDCETFDQVQVSSNESQNPVTQGDLLFNGSSETPEEVAFCSYMPKEVPDLFLNSFCFGFRLRDKRQVDGLFLSYYIRATPGRELMKSLAQGSTRYNLSKAALLQASLLLPPKEEQTAIATILSDMDAELAALDARLTKTRALKQAMMSELLTGKTRLPT